MFEEERDSKVAELKVNNPDKFVCESCYSISINKTANRARFEDGYWSPLCLQCYAKFIFAITNFNAKTAIENNECPF